MKKGYIVLEDGQIFEGIRFGSMEDTIGEAVFTTGMTGYVETLTDPSYFGQIVIQTFPMIGNYGVMPEDAESMDGKVRAFGYVVRDLNESPSNFRMKGKLSDFLAERGVPGLYGIDTRQLTVAIREKGTMTACICSDPLSVNLNKLGEYRVHEAVKNVSTSEPKTYPAETEKYKVALFDFGVKGYILKRLLERDCTVTIFPHNTKAEEVLNGGFDGVVLSNGPGDPAENTEVIGEIKQLLGRKPMLGICLGHQLMAAAAGGTTFKLKYGHRGVNQPVKDLTTGRTYITSQNHGYAVDMSSIPESTGIPMFINANDATCEGMSYPSLSAFSVQFHPEANGGPQDTEFLFDRFAEIMAKEA